MSGVEAMDHENGKNFPLRFEAAYPGDEIGGLRLGQLRPVSQVVKIVRDTEHLAETVSSLLLWQAGQ